MDPIKIEIEDRGTKVRTVIEFESPRRAQAFLVWWSNQDRNERLTGHNFNLETLTTNDRIDRSVNRAS